MAWHMFAPVPTKDQCMSVPLDETYRYGLMTRLPTAQTTRAITELLDELEFDSIWVGDHIAFTAPILDPFLQLAQVAAYSSRLTVGTGVYLLPMPNPHRSPSRRHRSIICRADGSFSASASMANFQPSTRLAACRARNAVRG